MRLALEAELLHERVIAALVFYFQILQMRAAVSNHLQEAVAAVLVFEVFLEVGGQFVDAFAQNGNLHFRRAGIGRMDGRLLNYLGLFGLGKHQLTLAQQGILSKCSLNIHLFFTSHNILGHFGIQ